MRLAPLNKREIPVKKSLSLLALAAAASFAGPVKFGADVLAGYNILSVGDSTGVKSSPSFGFAVGPTVSYGINEQIAIGGGVSFLYDINGVKAKEGDATMSMSQMSLGFQIAPSYQINEKIGVKFGYEWDMPLGGTSEVKAGGETMKSDIVWAPTKGSDIKEKEDAVLSTHNLVLGGSYLVMPNLAVVLTGKFALTGASPEYKYDDATGEIGDLKGSAKSEENISNHQIAIGVNYSFN